MEIRKVAILCILFFVTAIILGSIVSAQIVKSRMNAKITELKETIKESEEKIKTIEEELALTTGVTPYERDKLVNMIKELRTEVGELTIKSNELENKNKVYSLIQSYNY